MKNEDLDFLINLQKELLEQNEKYKLHQADPIYVGIMDYKWVRTDELCAYESRYMIDDTEFTNKELAEHLFNDCTQYYDEDGDPYSEEELEEIIGKFTTTKELQEFVKEHFPDDIEPTHCDVYGVMEESYIVTDAMFLTWREAEEHLKANRHRYSPKAHPFSMTAFRSPQLEKLLEIIKTTGWRMMKARQKGGKG